MAPGLDVVDVFTDDVCEMEVVKVLVDMVVGFEDTDVDRAVEDVDGEDELGGGRLPLGSPYQIPLPFVPTNTRP